MQASHAQILASPEIRQGLERVREAAYIAKYCESPMKYDRNLSFWRMSQQYCHLEKNSLSSLLRKFGGLVFLAKKVTSRALGDTYVTESRLTVQQQSGEFTGTWWSAGMILSGRAYELPRLVPNITGTDGGAWPTPRANQAMNASMTETLASHKHPNLEVIVAREMWATPNTLDSLPPKSPKALTREMTVTRPGRSKPANLRDQVSNMDMWATPQARDYRTGDNPDGKRAKRKAEQGWSQNLNDQVRMYPTPTTHNHKETGAPSQVNNRNTVQLGDLVVDAAMNSTTKDSENTDAQTVKAMRLNPRWVSWLMMWPVTWFDGTILKRKSGGSRTKSDTERTS